MSNDGWKPPETDDDIWRWFSGKHGDDTYTREIHRRWAIVGKLIEKGSHLESGLEAAPGANVSSADDKGVT